MTNFNNYLAFIICCCLSVHIHCKPQGTSGYDQEVPDFNPCLLAEIFGSSGGPACAKRNPCKSEEDLEDDPDCSGHGICVNNLCKCSQGYEGTFCDVCTRCGQEELCQGYEQCVKCGALNYHWDDEEEYLLECEEDCKDFVYTEVSTLDENQSDEINCQISMIGGVCKSFFTIPNESDVILHTPLLCQEEKTIMTTAAGKYTGQLSDCEENDDPTNLILPLEKRNQPNGYGVLIYGSPDLHNRKLYRGNFKCGKKHGRGFMAWNDGAYFFGSFTDDIKNGEGKMAYTNGDIYVGGWKNGEKQGQGMYTVSESGVRYVGLFDRGQIQGQGEIYKENDLELPIYVGLFDKGHKLNGKESWSTLSATVSYTGTFKNGFYHGEAGTFQSECGNVYRGPWENGMRHGENASFVWANGDKYVGDFKDGMPEGQGTFLWADGDKYHGKFLEGKIVEE